MFSLVIVIGFYGYLIFFLGIYGLIYKPVIIISSILFWSVYVFYQLQLSFRRKTESRLKFIKINKFILILLSLIIIQVLINLIGTIGPEHAFDALWYHLTLPKLYVQNHVITFFTGWLLYYSTMPKLTEMFYTVTLLFSNEVAAKLIHFSFGILILFVLYRMSRIFLDKQKSLLVLAIFYSNLVVDWMSITAYIDLTRTFYELLAFFAFLLFIKNRKNRFFLISAIFSGFAISTKLISIGSLLIYLLLISIYFKNNLRKQFQLISIYILVSLFIPLPWFIFSYIHTGNPIYPLFSGYPLEINFTNIINPLAAIKSFWEIFNKSSDPINPIYIIVLPLIFVIYKRIKPLEGMIFLYCFFSLIVWYLNPNTGGGRFILPYLPVFSIGVMIIIDKLKDKLLKNIFVGLIIVFTLTSIIYRGVANSKYIPILLGRETKAQFLNKYLHFDFGDFYDIDGYFAKTIKPTDKVLIYGIHNLYYVDFPFIHESYLKKGDWFNYILISNGILPQKYSNWKLIYQNNTTKIKLFKL
jgi:hypothetical protein